MSEERRFWFIPGYHGASLIAILCRVVERDEWGGMWLDEPVGHAVSADEVLESQEAAQVELSLRREETEEPLVYPTLQQFRESRIAFLRSTGAKGPFEYPEKGRGREWFS